MEIRTATGQETTRQAGIRPLADTETDAGSTYTEIKDTIGDTIFDCRQMGRKLGSMTALKAASLTSLDKYQLLTEDELLDAQDQYGEDAFSAGIGAEAVKPPRRHPFSVPRAANPLSRTR